MAIDPVDYKRASSTGFINESYGVPPQDVPIDSSTANALKKDVQQGNASVDDNQQTWIEAYSTDDINYSLEESEQIGRNEIDAESLEGINEDRENLRAGEASTGGFVGVTSEPLGKATGGQLDKFYDKKSFEAGVKKNREILDDEIKNNKFEGEGTASDDTVKAAEKAEDKAKIPFAALAAGAIALAGGLMANNAANTFDAQYDERIAQMNESANNMALLQVYSDNLNDDLKNIGEDTVDYMSLSEDYTNTRATVIHEISTLESEHIVAVSQGNMTRAGEIEKTELPSLYGELDNNSTADELNNLRSTIDTAANYNAQAQGVKESGDTVSAFLKDGADLGTAATIQCVSMGIAAALMVKGTINAITSAAKLPAADFVSAAIKVAAVACAIAGAAMMTTGNVLTIAAAVKFGIKAVNEFKANKSGKDMGDTLGTLGTSITSSNDALDAARNSIEASDTESTEIVSGVKLASANANGQLAQNTGVTYGFPGATVGGGSGGSGGSTSGNTSGGTV